MLLSDTKIRRLIPSSKCTPSRPDKYTDHDGLRLWIRHTGTKVWVSDYTFHGKRRSFTHGKYPIISLAEARIAHQHLLEQIHKGIDPRIYKKELQAQANGSHSFSRYADEWHAKRKDNLKKGTYTREYNQYKRDIKPIIGDMNINDITPLQILAIGQEIEKRGAKDMARRAILQVKRIFEYAILLGATTNNPANNLSKALPPRKKEHFKRINIHQLPALLKAMNNYQGDIMVKHALWVICYTFVRTSELRFMQWNEIDYQAKIWRIPADKMKMNRPHNIPLAPQVIKILQTIKSYNFDDTYVFYNVSKGKPYSENFLLSALKKMGYRGKMTGHGFRGLASTTLHELGYLHEAIELQLAHEPNNAVSRAYNGAKHLDYRTNMMNEWANYIDENLNKATQQN